MSEDLGFKAGLEIHQQLEGKKLFCDTPTRIREDEPDFTITRQLRASTGESGEVDVAASHEQKKQKTFVYQGYQDTISLVELDEEPVSAPNPLAVETAVMVSEMLSLKRFDTVHFMRKVVVDGSNTSGFQRTAAIASDGMINDVRVDRLCLEEDSCKLVQRGSDQDIYNLSRLGIPLLEITTKPDITSPQHLQDTAAAIGMVLRSTGRVKRGLGTIRQDVNISIREGARVEIKGVQDLESMPVLADNEVKRQAGLVMLSKEIDSVEVSAPITVSDGLSQAQGWVENALKTGAAVGVKITNFSGILGRELFEGFRVGTEIAGYAKAWGFGGIIHSDEDPAKYKLDSWDAVSSLLGCSENDSFMLLIGDETRAHDALEHAITPRLQELAVGVPSCVRKANADCSTTYMRPMPGSARMYPETDVHTLDITNIDVELPELLSEKIPRIAQQYKVDEGVVSVLERAGRIELFENYSEQVGSALAVDILVSKEKELKKRHSLELNVEDISDELVAKLADGSINKSAIEDVLVQFAQHASVDWNSFKTMDESAVRKIIEEVVAADPQAPMGALMGAAMKRLGGKADGKLVSQLIREQLQ